MRKSQVQKRVSHAPAAAQRPAGKQNSDAELITANAQSFHQPAQPTSVSVTLANSSAAQAQRKRVASLQNSPRLIAQREKVRTLQLKENNGIAREDAAVAQRAGVEEEEPMQGKFETAQRMEEEELMQGKFETAQRMEEEELMQGKFETAQLEEAAAAPNKTGLPDNLKTGIESLSGVSMDAVRVHYNSDKPAQLNALAYAQGTDIHVAGGQEKHLPHEAWHVVQQAQGRVKPTAELGGARINDDKSLENEADTMGARAMQFKAAKTRSAGK